MRAFPTLDEKAIKEILSTPGYYTEVGEGLMSMVNDRDGLMKVTECSSATSYTVAALAKNAGGEEVLLVNSIGTKSIADEKTWFVTSLGVNENYQPTSEKIIASLKGVNIVAVRYGLFKTENIAEVPKSLYSRLVEDYGHDIAEGDVEHVNDGGIGFICNAEPSTSYTLIATATNTAGDKITKYSVNSTTAPAAAPAPVKSNFGDRSGVIYYGIFDVIPGMEGRTVTEQMPFSEDELWREIHNQKLLEKR